MRGRLLLLLLTVSFLGCSEEELPSGLLDYQVERLLSGQSGTKVWSQIISSTNCSDSTKLLFVSITDSLDVSELNHNPECTLYDTLYLGRASASKASGSELFTDSLIFSSNTHWIISQVTSENLSLNDQNGSELSFSIDKQ